MLELHAIADPERDVGAGSRAFPSRSPHCPPIARDAIDFVLVPGVAFDRDGRRLGYGGGYYDRLLPLLSPRAARVAGAFDLQVVERVPAGPHDIAVDTIVTEIPRPVGTAMSVRRVEGRGTADAASRTAAIALAITLAIQIFTSLAATATRCSRRRSRRDLGIAPKLVGVFVGLVYAGSMAASLASRRVHRALRRDPRVAGLRAAVRGGLVADGAGAASLHRIGRCSSLAPVVIGLGYGPITPASSHVLARTAPPSRMALTFSIKQTGVPAGAALPGACCRCSRCGSAGTPRSRSSRRRVVIVAAAQPGRARALDADRTPARALSIARRARAALRVLRTPRWSSSRSPASSTRRCRCA